MDKSMEIAILMSTYNGEKYLSKQIKSIAEQSVAKNIHLYIRDDGSTDDTFNIIEEWSKNIKITLFKHNNIGPGKSFWWLMTNKDIVADYYAFCDQDDIWDSNKIENAIKELSDDILLYISNCRLIDQNDLIIEDKLRINKPYISLQRQFVSGVAQGCSMVFTNKLRNIVIDSNPMCIPLHDTVVILYALANGKVFWEQNTTFSYRMHENNVVAKDKKSFISKLKTTYKNWMNGSDNSMSDVASELLKNCNTLTFDETEYLNLVKNYRKNIFNRLKLIFKTDYSCIPTTHVRSYILRILFNLY